MSIIDFQHLQQQIKNKLFEISYKIECFNKSGDFDISRYAETYFKLLLNIIYKKDGWNFEKATKINQDTYDLYDIANKVYIQITSNNRTQKKLSTIKQFEEKYCNDEFSTLIILFTSNSKPKKTFKTNEFNYLDFDIVEFSSLIESKCGQTELLKIRDILLQNLDLQRNMIKATTNNRNNIKVTEKEFLRCKKLEKVLREELIFKDYWKKIDREELVKYPDRKFKDSRFILRSIEDESYPNVDDNSSWCRAFMYDFYERGILIWLDALFGTKAIINEKEEWYIEDYEDRGKPIPNGCTKLNIRILGKLPFKNIVHYEDGDEYYNDYHLFCKYLGVENSPYEGIVYKYENLYGYFWGELDLAKKIER